ncbi:MAG: transcriptional regulator CynR [Sedimenticolaceae bacterium]
MNRRDVFPRSLQYLIAIAEHGSYTRAAEILHVSQPSLSQQIKLLEQALQTSLFDRSGRNVRLTHAGEVYLNHVRRAWHELDEGTRAISDIDDLSRGRLRLGWTPITDQITCCLLDRFNTRYPGISLSTLEMPQDEIVTALMEGRIDVGIAFTNSITLGSRLQDVDAHTLFEETLGVAVGNDHPRAGQQESMTPEELEQEFLVLLNSAFIMRRLVDGYCFEHAIEPHIAVETNSLNVIVEMIQIGSRATVLPSSIVRNQCGLHFIGLSPDLPRQAVTAITRKNGYNNAGCVAFIDMAKEWAESRAQEIPPRRRVPCPLQEVKISG